MKNQVSTIIKYIYITIGIDLLIALILFLYLTNFDFIGLFNFLSSLIINLSIGIFGLFLIGNLVGKNLWRLKSNEKKYKISHGIIAIFIVLIFGTLIGSCVGFIQEGLPNNRYEYKLKEELYDYFFKPIYWILIFGFIPTLISGFFLGLTLRKL